MFAVVILKIHTVLINIFFSYPFAEISNNNFGFSFFNSHNTHTSIFYLTFKYITLTIFFIGIGIFCYLVYKAYKENKKHKDFYQTHHVHVNPEDIAQYTTKPIQNK